MHSTASKTKGPSASRGQVLRIVVEPNRGEPHRRPHAIQKNGTLVRPKNICAAPLKRHFRGYVVEDQRPRAGDESARQVTVSDVGGSRESSRRLTFRIMPHGGYRSAPSAIAALAGFVQD